MPNSEQQAQEWPFVSRSGNTGNALVDEYREYQLLHPDYEKRIEKLTSDCLRILGLSAEWRFQATDAANEALQEYDEHWLLTTARTHVQGSLGHRIEDRILAAAAFLELIRRNGISEAEASSRVLAYTVE